MFVLGTAGHIDHGKSSLIRAMTGIDPDRLPEEKERGMTIDLGFAWLNLPDGERVGFVDVPGHERFVRNMVAGAGGVNAAMLVVAADDGWMPQTQEHFDILRLLDVKYGLVAITKIDLVERDWLDLVIADVAAKVAGSFLEGAPIIPVSSTTGEGVEKAPVHRPRFCPDGNRRCRHRHQPGGRLFRRQRRVSFPRRQTDQNTHAAVA